MYTNNKCLQGARTNIHTQFLMTAYFFTVGSLQ